MPAQLRGRDNRRDEEQSRGETGHDGRPELLQHQPSSYFRPGRGQSHPSAGLLRHQMQVPAALHGSVLHGTLQLVHGADGRFDPGTDAIQEGRLLAGPNRRDRVVGRQCEGDREQREDFEVDR